MTHNEFLTLLLLAGAALACQIALLWRSRSNVDPQQAERQRQYQDQMQQQSQELTLERIDRVEREVRMQLQTSAQATRQEMGASLAQFHAATVQQLDGMRVQIQSQGQSAREEQSVSLARFADMMRQTLAGLTESNAQRLLEVRATLEARIKDLQLDNGARLEEMRKTVDEKLHATLELRLSESFKQVSERLERVHQGLGEMQQLAIGVGDLKRVLTNVKTRGTWGEVQLEMLLEQVLTTDQYAKNVETVAGTGARVEFALKLPGAIEGGAPVWMPIDAKFPKEQYERLVDAAERADVDGVATAGRELERAVRIEAKSIADKYLAPPQTTDFAILFLPTEGLYAEVMRRPGLADELQRVHRVSIAGPSTLSALLNSLQMGFRTLALEKRSSEVWQVLGAVKTEFAKFGDVLAATRINLERAAKNIETAEMRSRQMVRKLKSVEALPSEAAQLLLGADSEGGDPL
jgi:DNA recombination protein RmuC